MIFVNRKTYQCRIGSLEEAAAFDRYLDSRNKYKLDFIDLVCSRIGQGPVLDWSGGSGCVGLEVLRRKRGFSGMAGDGRKKQRCSQRAQSDPCPNAQHHRKSPVQGRSTTPEPAELRQKSRNLAG